MKTFYLIFLLVGCTLPQTATRTVKPINPDSVIFTNDPNIRIRPGNFTIEDALRFQDSLYQIEWTKHVATYDSLIDVIDGLRKKIK